MKIFLDDYRTVPEGSKGFSVVRNYRDCIQLIELFREDTAFIDLDYDLGTKETGLDVLKYMAEHNIRPKRINIHSDHPEGVPEMVRYANEKLQSVVLTTIKAD